MTVAAHHMSRRRKGKHRPVIGGPATHGKKVGIEPHGRVEVNDFADGQIIDL
jgi:hypothetical protein